MIDQRTEQQKDIDRRVKSRVIQGITMLEEHYGPDWADKIDLDSLELASAQSCVLGQLYGDFEKGVQRLWGANNEAGYKHAKDAGFLMDSDLAKMLYADDVIGEFGYYSYLDRAWIEEIRSIQAAK